MKGRATALVILAAAVGLLMAWLGWSLRPAPPPKVREIPLSYNDLTGWADDDHSAALMAFRRSCSRGQPHASMADPATRAAWGAACAEAAQVADNDARAFFERYFSPFLIAVGKSHTGTLTGYYEPELDGRRQRELGFDTPIYALPPDLLRVDLGQFAQDLKGRQIMGRVDGNRLVPYYTRAEIASGQLADRGLELFWVADPIAAFFLEIQGSGRIRLEDGSIVRVGYAGKNGHAYTAIGRTLIDDGVMTPETASLQSIRAWLEANPDHQRRVFDSNASHVFFRILTEEGPVGSEGVVLSPGRSLAVDYTHVPLGLPVWIEGRLPDEAGGGHLRRLMIAQDTGGAIRGAMRGDVFWGPGETAELIAGHMKDQARFVLLRPRVLAERP
jgi:membrane-bound lytic murein transglycosylase A